MDIVVQGSAYVQHGGAYVSCSVQLSLAPDSDDPLVQFEMEAMNSVPKVCFSIQNDYNSKG
jgi:hypothetical protein